VRNPAGASCSTWTRAPATDVALGAVLAEARDLGFLGPGPVEDHRRHAAAFVRALADRPPGLGVDLGSGGGVPALVVATALADWRWELVEAGERRAAFLIRAVDQLELGHRVRVRHERAEDVGRSADDRARAAAVTARSFAPPPVTAECGAPLLELGGVLVVSEPPGGEAGRWDPVGVATLGLGEPEVRPGPPTVAVLVQSAPCPARFPRRAGIPAKRPLW
jgi:16S rRNA (guanine527-N7)-methyltransferase